MRSPTSRAHSMSVESRTPRSSSTRLSKARSECSRASRRSSECESNFDETGSSPCPRAPAELYSPKIKRVVITSSFYSMINMDSNKSPYQ
jgi:hypothetical protein